MHDLRIPATASSPYIAFDASAGVLAIQGESYPENALAFYRPLIDWLHVYLAETTRPIDLHIDLIYLNTGSIRFLMDILDLLEDAYRDGRIVQVYWHYDEENDRSLETAEEFREDLSVPFTLLAKPMPST